MLAASGN